MVTPLRIAFFGTPAFALATLEALYRSAHEIVLVVTQPDRPRGRGQKLTHSPVKAFAVAEQIPVLQPERLKDETLLAELAGYHIDLGVVAYPQYWPVFGLVTVFLLVVIVISQIRPAALWILEQGERVGFLRKITQSAREFYEGSFALFRPGSTLLAVCLGAVSWLGEGIGFYFIMLGLGMEPSQRLLAMSVFILSFSTIVGAASALPGGLGAAEVSIAGMLTFPLQQDPAIASAATLLIRLATLWFGVLLGLGVWAFTPNLIGFNHARQPIPEA